MEIVKSAVAGTMESSDAYVEIEPAESLNVQLESVVQQQFSGDMPVRRQQRQVPYLFVQAAGQMPLGGFRGKAAVRIERPVAHYASRWPANGARCRSKWRLRAARYSAAWLRMTS